MALISAIAISISVILTKYIIDSVILNQYDQFWKYVAIELSLGLSFLIVESLYGINYEKFFQNAIIYIKNHLSKHISQYGYDQFNKKSPSFWLNVFNNDIHQIVSDNIGNKIHMPMILFRIIAGIVSVFWLNWILGLVIILVIIIFNILSFVLSKYIDNQNAIISKAKKNFIEQSNNLFDNFNEMFYANQTNVILQNSQIITQSIFAKYFYKIKIMNYILRFQWAINMLFSSLIFFVIGYLIISSYLLPGILVAVISMHSLLSEEANDLALTITEIRSVNKLIKKFQKITSAKIIDTQKHKKIIEEPFDNIEFKNVLKQFDKKVVLNDLSFVFQNKHKYAIIGHSGVGKITLINILLGIQSPNAGEVLFNGISYKNIHNKSIIKKIAYLSNKPLFFPLSILDNIKLFKNNQLDSQTQMFLKSLNMKKLYRKKVNNLSEGEKQTIALSRALYANYEIIIMDEALSAIDKSTSKQIMNFLLNELDTTIIIISHHFHLKNLQKFDSVIDFQSLNKS